MPRKAICLLLTLSLFLNLPLALQKPLTLTATEQRNIIQQSSLSVRNLDTGKSYATIQEAITDSETVNGNRISVASGTYYESIVINKSVSIVGENKVSTIIDGNGASRVIYVTASNVEIKGFTIQNGTFGLWLYYSNNSKISDNILQDGSYGIRLLNSANTIAVGNTVRRYTFFGFEIDTSGNSTLRDNIIEDNRYNFGVNGKSLFDFTNDIDISNTVNGQPIRYLMKQHDLSVESSSYQGIGFLGFVNSQRISIRDLTVQNNIEGILLAFSEDSNVTQVDANSNWNGIYIAYSSNMSATHNQANRNFDYGIKFFNSPQSQAIQNNVDNNGWGGIGIFGSPNSIVAQNEASYNSYDLHLVFTNNSVISQNTALKKPGGYSIAVYYSHNNLIYHNTLENALLYVESRNRMRYVPPNNWDNGLEGNFWNGYQFPDANLDGIGDTPRIVGENNTDHYPLMGKYQEFTVSLENQKNVISIISNSTLSEMQFDPNNSTLSLIATGENGTQGFMRLAVSNFFENETEGDLNFLVNRELPAIKHHWQDENRTYFYFQYANAAPEPTINLVPFLGILVLVTILVSLLYFVFLRKKRSVAERTDVQASGHD